MVFSAQEVEAIMEAFAASPFVVERTAMISFEQLREIIWRDSSRPLEGQSWCI